MPDYSPQLSASFLCLRACVIGDLAGVAASFDTACERGEDLLRTAVDQGLGPLLYRRLHETGLLSRLPTATVEPLHALHRRMLTLQAGAGEITRRSRERLVEAGVTEVLPLKGVALAARLWPDYLPRGLVDVDLLVAPEQVVTARAALVRAGFAAPPIPWTPDPWEYHLPRLEYGGMGVELHWRLWPPSPLLPFTLPSAAELFARRATGTLNDTPLAVPSAADQLLILASALAQDGFAVGLRHWADLYWFLSTLSPGEQTQAARLAAEQGLGEYLGLILALLAEIIGPSAWSLPSGCETACEQLRPVIWRRLLDPQPRRSSLWMLRALAPGRTLDPHWVEGLPPELRTQARRTAAASAVRHCGGVLLAGGKLATRAGRLLVSAHERRAWRDDLLLAQVLGRMSQSSD